MTVTWVKYRNMGGPRCLGEKEGKNFVHVYNPPKPWGIWTQILGVVARSEGRFDTVVMYDESGVTAGPFQWTFKSGRLQKMLEFLKTIPYYDFQTDKESNLFDKYCIVNGRQIFERFGFKIENGKFVIESSGVVLDPSDTKQQKTIVDICMGRRSLTKDAKGQAMALCSLFAELGREPDIQVAMVEYAKLEFKNSLDVKRPPLQAVGGTIRCLLPTAVWGSPIPAIFFNLYQNAPMGAFKLFMNAMEIAHKKGILEFPSFETGYEAKSSSSFPQLEIRLILDIIWTRLNNTAYADWGFRSKQYLESKGKNPPRIMNIRPAIKEFYGIDLSYVGKI